MTLTAARKTVRFRLTKNQLRQQRMHDRCNHQPGLTHQDTGRAFVTDEVRCQHFPQQGHLGLQHVALPQAQEALHPCAFRHQQAQRRQRSWLPQGGVQAIDDPFCKRARSSERGGRWRLLPCWGRQQAGQQGLEDLLLALKMRIQAALGQAAPPGNIFHARGRKATLRELHQGSIQNLQHTHLGRQTLSHRSLDFKPIKTGIKGFYQFFLHRGYDGIKSKNRPVGF